ncbi:TPA: hypothetical protein GRI80_15065 [Vibrio parahaemolyticus]|nr:hypothetical protein BSG32_06595 [Vibrio parahaemolyticus]EGQ8684728.1 hypothetical protein [Vibrio parahaemolyticus]EGQ8783170.1 hypothetical protein [Vibrio parahaemolyticus]EGQ8831650.1 hypothetical protein [Vibrio parahaemolyticus]EGQ8868320.1 hypothetical protein [Vibrio parahaemolyticus]
MLFGENKLPQHCALMFHLPITTPKLGKKTLA